MCARALRPGRKTRGLTDAKRAGVRSRGRNFQLNRIACATVGGAGDELAERGRAGGAAAQPIAVELIAVLVAVADGSPLAMTIDSGRALPSGPFEVGHRSLQSGLRAWVERQTGHPLGYVEQLYTFADSDRRGRRRRRPGHFDQLSRPHARGAHGGARGGLATLVSITFPGRITGPACRP